MVSRRQDATETRDAALDIAERLVQLRGFNGFSYADIATELGVTKAALHYHFPGKAELGETLIDRYASRFRDALAAIDADGIPAPDKLRAYCAIYLGVLRAHRMCLCGMLAAEYDTLPPPMRAAIAEFFDDNERWLAGLLEGGRASGDLAFVEPARQAAQTVVATLEGAMLVARPRRDASILEAAVVHLLAAFAPSTAQSRRRPPRRSVRGQPDAGRSVRP
jgi:TetR/AcrR family transcriptional repressor of nem operon